MAVLLGAADHDQAVFDEPENLNLSREHNPHVSFGMGVDYCLGAPLARLELHTALPILLERFPDLQLTAQPQFMNSYHFRGLEELQEICN